MIDLSFFQEFILRDFMHYCFILANLYVLGSWKISKYKMRLICVGVILFDMMALLLFGHAVGMQWYGLGRIVLEAAPLFAFMFLMKDKGAKRLVPIITAVTSVTLFSMSYLLTRILFENYFIIIAIIIVGQIIGLTISAKLIQKPLKTMMASLDKSWWSISFCIGFPVLTFCFISAFPTGGTGQIGYYIAICGMALTCLANYVMIFALYRSIRSQYEIREQNRVMEIQLATTKAETELADSMEREARILTHDLRHVASVINTALGVGDYEMAKETTDALIKRIDASDKRRFVKYCDRPMLNACINFYIDQAEAVGAKVDVNVRLDHELRCEDLELAVVISNCLDNAARAIESMGENADRRLYFLARFVNKQLLVKVSNSYTGNLLLDDETGLPTTTEKGHGTGMISILSFAKKYDAVLQCSHEDGLFTISLLI